MFISQLLFTDADIALPLTKYNYYIWYIRKNLKKNLKGKFDNKYIDFISV